MKNPTPKGNCFSGALSLFHGQRWLSPPGRSVSLWHLGLRLSMQGTCLPRQGLERVLSSTSPMGGGLRARGSPARTSLALLAVSHVRARLETSGTFLRP